MNRSVLLGYIPPRYNREEAQQRLHIPLFYRFRVYLGRWLFSRLGKSIPLNFANLPKYELVAWPLYIVRFSLQSGTDKTQDIYIAVDAWAKTIARFERMQEIKEIPTVPFDLVIHPTIALEEVKTIARYGLIQQLLRQRKMQPAPDMIVPEVERLVFTPIWACYFARTLYSLDVRLLDAYTGEKIGAQARSSFLNALVHRSTEFSNEESFNRRDIS